MTENTELLYSNNKQIRFKDGNKMLRVTTKDHEITIEVNNGQGAFSSITLSEDDTFDLHDWLGYCI